MKIIGVRSRHAAGFLILELVIALAITAILVTGLYKLARATVLSTTTTIEVQNEEITKDAFFRLLENHFMGLPGNTQLELTYEESGGPYLSEFIFENTPTAFNWGGKSISAQTTVLSTQLRRDGLLNVILRYHENSLLDDERGANDSEETEPIASIILLEEVRLFEWRVLDQRTLEWQYQWDQRGRLPTQVEVVVAFGANGEELRRVFWIPAKENP